MIEAQVRTTKPETVAFIEMSGPFEQIPEAMGELYGWVSGHGYRVVGPPEEVYFSDPAEVPASEYLTEVQFPVARRVEPRDEPES